MGIIFIVNLEIGYLTPPVGLNLFVSSTLFGKGLGEIIRSVVPTLLLLFIGLIAITRIPGFSTGLVDMIHAPAAVTPAGTPDAPTEESQPASGVKSLQELMKGTQGSGNAPGKVKSLQELMKGLPAPAAPTAPPKVKSLQELMQESAPPKTESPKPADPTPAEE